MVLDSKTIEERRFFSNRWIPPKMLPFISAIDGDRNV